MCRLSTPGRFHWSIFGSKDVLCKWALADWDPAKHTSTSKPAFCSDKAVSRSWNTTVKHRRWCFMISAHLLLLSLLAAGEEMTVFPLTGSCFVLCAVSHRMFQPPQHRLSRSGRVTKEWQRLCEGGTRSSLPLPVSSRIAGCEGPASRLISSSKSWQRECN